MLSFTRCSFVGYDARIRAGLGPESRGISHFAGKFSDEISDLKAAFVTRSIVLYALAGAPDSILPLNRQAFLRASLTGGFVADIHVRIPWLRLKDAYDYQRSSHVNFGMYRTSGTIIVVDDRSGDSMASNQQGGSSSPTRVT